jgi:CheY-like chemotaxis protein
VPKTILVVEDDADLRRLFVLTLTLAGYVVRQAADGLEALRLLDPVPPDLVVLDLVLPALSGVFVQQEIAAHAHTRHIPIVVVTGSTTELPETQCLLRKPVTPDRLLQVVRDCLAAGAPPLGA